MGEMMTDKTHGLDSQFEELDNKEKRYLDNALYLIGTMARRESHKRPKITTLLEEMAELILSCRGKHDDPIELELFQIASVATNLLWQHSMGIDINNIITYRGKDDAS